MLRIVSQAVTSQSVNGNYLNYPNSQLNYFPCKHTALKIWVKIVLIKDHLQSPIQILINKLTINSNTDTKYFWLHINKFLCCKYKEYIPKVLFNIFVTLYINICDSIFLRG